MNRLEKLKEQNPELNISIIDVIAHCEPTNSYKYMNFLIRILKNEHVRGNDYESLYRRIGLDLFGVENLIQLMEFEKHSRSNRIINNDIGQYKNFKEIIESVEKVEYEIKLKEVEKDVIKLYDSEFWLVLIPLSFESSKIYGYNTKWCTTQIEHWTRYIPIYKLIYIIEKKTNNKWAISIDKSSKEVLGWLANDKKINAYDLPFSNDIFNIIIPEIKKFESITDIIKNKK